MIFDSHQKTLRRPPPSHSNLALGEGGYPRKFGFNLRFPPEILRLRNSCTDAFEPSKSQFNLCAPAQILCRTAGNGKRRCAFKLRNRHRPYARRSYPTACESRGRHCPPPTSKSVCEPSFYSDPKLHHGAIHVRIGADDFCSDLNFSRALLWRIRQAHPHLWKFLRE